MGQITIYLDPELEKKIRAEARTRRMSLSKCIAALVEQRTSDTWPESVKHMAGAWPDFPSLGDIREGIGGDVPRGSL